VIDPRTGWPVVDALLGCVLVDTATESDALSTAVLLANEAELERLSISFPALKYLQARSDSTAETIKICARGLEVAPCVHKVLKLVTPSFGSEEAELR
jgi:hypothetical protein